LALQNRINQALAEPSARWASDDAYGAWSPPVDIFEKGEDLIIRAELAGVRREDIDVRIEENTLLLSGERRKDEELEQGRAYRVERAVGPFTRRFALPATVDPARISARYVDGLLELTLPKSERARPRKIAIDLA
jgi:HSP20 family protein